MLAKAPRLPFKSKCHQLSTKVLELIHFDLSGIIRISNQNRYNYYMTFTDDYSRYTITYLLHNKNDAFEAFKKYKEYVNKHIGSKFGTEIRKFRTDGGLEYMNKQFIDELELMGIQKQTTCPYSAQQNGVSEHINRVLGDMVTAFLTSSKLPEQLWPYAVLHATNVKNRLSHSSINYDIPYEKFFNEKVVCNDIHEFGEKVIFVSTKDAGKFRSNNDYGHYVGRPAGTNGWYVYVPSTGKVIIPHDVYFLSHKFNEIPYNGEKFTNLFDHELKDHESNLDIIDSDILNSEDEFALCPLARNAFKSTNNEITEPISLDISLQDTAATINGLESDTVLDSFNNSNSSTEEMPTGEIFLTAKEKVIFQKRFPNASLEFIAPTHTGKRNPPCKYLVNSITIPKSYQQVLQSNEKSFCLEATNVEYLSHIKNGTWKLVKRTPDMQVLPCFWLFTTKTDTFDIINRYKARLVCLSNRQRKEENVNPLDFSSPVINGISIKLLLALAVNYRFKVRHLDIKTAFIHAKLKYPLYMTQAPGYEINGKEYACQLIKSIYGLRCSSAN